jgi:uncharacterized protein (TIGR02271 family)
MGIQAGKPDKGETPEVTVPVIQEEIVAGTRRVKTGSVRVEKQVEKRLRKIEAPLIRDEFEVKRVAVNRVVAEAPPVRTRGDTVIVPILEEELIVTKRLVLVEEIHLIKRRTKKRITKEIEVARETARVRRMDAQGQAVDPQPDNPPARTKKGWGSVLG